MGQTDSRFSLGPVFLGTCLLASLLLLTQCSDQEPVVVNSEATQEAAAEVESNAQEQPFYLSLETPPAPELSPAEELQTFRIAGGLHIELVASEPLVEDPVSILWDEDGKLYVVEMRGFMPDAYGNGEDEPIGSVVRLTDQDSDGQMDHSEVLADGLVLPRAISIVPEGLLIAEPPNLWLCPGELNQASTIDCSEKISLGEYGNQPGSVEHAENALLLALDNWIYNAKSDRKMQIRDGELVVEKTVFRGQWGLAQDDDGFLYYNSNSNLITGDLYPDADAIQAGVRPTPGLSQRLHRGDEVYSIRVNPGVNRAYLDGVLRPDGRLKSPTAASGVEIFRGDQLPESFYGTAFVPESAGNLVAQLALSKADLDFQSEHITYPDADWGSRDFMASTDERFRPVQVKTGPEGALYVVDMYRGIIQDHVFLSDQLRAQVLDRELQRPLGMGRIWRVVHTDSAIDHKQPQSFSRDIDAMIGYLQHPNAWWRETAQRMLVAAESVAVKPALLATLESDNTNAVVHALWTLQGRGELEREQVIALMDSGDQRLTLHALRAGCDLLGSADLMPALQQPSLSNSEKQALLFCTSRHFNDGIYGYVADNANDLLSNPYLVVALQTVMQGHETELLEILSAQSSSAALDSSIDLPGLFQSLAAQSVRNAAVNLGQESIDGQQKLLDFVLQAKGANWQYESLLAGIYQASHGTNFQRIVLAAPHPLFTQQETEQQNSLPELAALQGAVTDARSAYTWPGDVTSAGQKPLDAESQTLVDTGATLFASQCAACHGVEGQGTAGLAPSLRQSTRIVDAPEQLIRIILQGLTGPVEVQGEVWDGNMPGMAHLAEFDDDGISGLVSFLRRSWGHDRSIVLPETVSEVRGETQAKTLPWTHTELTQVPINTRYRAFAGRYGGLEFRYNGRELEVHASIFFGSMEEVGDDSFFFEPRNLRFEFDRIVDDQSTVVWTTNDSGKNRIPRREN